jgi:hypothetical protein
MILNQLDKTFGLTAQNKIEDTKLKSFEGALACLETFYYSFNNKDLNTFKKIWYKNNLIQLNNPLGGIVRGIEPITNIYDKIFNGKASIWVEFTDIVCYQTPEMIVFAGVEIGESKTKDETINLKIRTTRIFGYSEDDKSWFQLHHHGSIDNAKLLDKYQKAVRK